VSGPAWLAGSIAVLMVVIAAYRACRLAVAGLHGRNTEIDTDGLHVLMGDRPPRRPVAGGGGGTGARTPAGGLL